LKLWAAESIFTTGVNIMSVRTPTAILHKEGQLFVAECPEVGTVSQGNTLEEAVANLREKATELYLEEFPISSGL
jgi:predicted RNase H-like HicB family nuclease